MELPDLFFDSLTEEGQEAAPVNVRLMPAGEPEVAAAAPIAESSFYRSRGFLCHDFHKPISRCLPDRR
jgi:hypothetical protein